jgi:hypothetical protein
MRRVNRTVRTAAIVVVGATLVAMVAVAWSTAGDRGIGDAGPAPTASSSGAVVLDASQADPVPTPSASLSVTDADRSPLANVVCSDMSQHLVPVADLDGATVGDVIDLHGTPCLVEAVPETAAEVDPRERPRYHGPP